jgi:hypothetical protein
MELRGPLAPTPANDVEPSAVVVPGATDFAGLPVVPPPGSHAGIHDEDAAATIPSRRFHPHWPAHAIARVWHHPAARPDDQATA